MDLPLEFVEKFCQKEKANRIYHFPGEAWSQVQGGVRNDWWPCFLVIRIGNRKYEFSGYGSSKKTAKIAAAQRAVKKLQSVYGGPGTGGHSGASAGGGASGTIPGAGAGVAASACATVLAAAPAATSGSPAAAAAAASGGGGGGGGHPAPVGRGRGDRGDWSCSSAGVAKTEN